MEKLYYDINKPNENLAAIYRNDILLTYEAEFDKFLTEETVWSEDSSYFIHEGFIYYSKKRLNELYDNEEKEFLECLENEYPSSNISEETIQEYLEKFNTPILKMEDLLKEELKCFPNLIVETPHFYQCDYNIKRQLNVDDIDKEIVQKIKKLFTDDINPLLYDLQGFLYEDNYDKVYCLKPLNYSKNIHFKYGFFMTTKQSLKYSNDLCIFFSFDKLSVEERNIIISYYRLINDYDNEPKKRNLIFVEF
jgi:hypothetical protein